MEKSLGFSYPKIFKENYWIEIICVIFYYEK